MRIPASLKAAREYTKVLISIPLLIFESPSPQAISIPPETPISPPFARMSAKSLEKAFSKRIFPQKVRALSLFNDAKSSSIFGGAASSTK